ncbi:MAG: TetR/AcrR family transcriptional regulator [Treponema sp.]|nr:TetR/AcrR family transcriptional regulator [Treponema sp.]
MTAKEKFIEEKDEMKQNRKNRILESAFNLFSQKGIDTIAMTDIAKKAEIGVASLYRYYETKEEIAIRTVIWAWEKQKESINPLFTSDDFEKLSGLEQIEAILRVFTHLYESQKDFLRFIYFFDSFAVRTEIQKDRLEDYEAIIATVQEVVAKAISKGLKDGSINASYKDSQEEMYFALMHSFFSTCQKLTLSGHLLKSDELVSGSAQLKIMSDIIIKGLKN